MRSRLDSTLGSLASEDSYQYQREVALRSEEARTPTQRPYFQVLRESEQRRTGSLSRLTPASCLYVLVG